MRRAASLLLGAVLAATAFARIADDLAVANQYFHTRDLDRAVCAYRQILDHDPATAEAHYGLIRSYLGLSKLEEAESAALRAAETMPDSAVAHLGLADVYFRRGRFTPAEAEYKTAIHLDGKLARAWLGLGRLFYSASLRKSAMVYFDRAHRLDPNDPAILRVWAEFQPPAVEIAALERYVRMVDRSDIQEIEFTRSHIALHKALNGRRPYRLDSTYAPSEAPLSPILMDAVNVRGWGLEVRINGSKPHKLLLDTGAGGIAIGKKLGDSLHLKRAATVHLRGLGDQGSVEATVAIASRVEVGGIVFVDCPITVSERHSVADEEGIIGLDIFEQFLVTLDSPAHRIRLEPYPGLTAPPNLADEDRRAPAESKFSQVFRFGHVLLVPARAEGSQSGLFVIDTGATRNLLSTIFARGVTKLVSNSKLHLKGISGRVSQIFTAPSVSLEFGGLKHPPVDMPAIDLTNASEATETEISGLFGFPLLSILRVTVNYRDGLVQFGYTETEASSSEGPRVSDFF